MINYKISPEGKMENLECDIELLGTTPSSWIPSIIMGVLSVTLYPLLIFVVMGSVLIVDRWRFKRLKSGRPITYSPFVLRNKNNRLIKFLFPKVIKLKEGYEFRRT